MKSRLIIICVLAFFPIALTAQEEHDHPAPEKLGKVSFATSCSRAVEQKFNRAVALLHSFAYSAAEKAFRDVLHDDPQCAMAHWGVAMTYYHQLWEPPNDARLAQGHDELAQARGAGKLTDRETGYINALTAYYTDFDKVSKETRANYYVRRMEVLAERNPSDDEAQIFYALSLLGTASMLDKTHANQKRAAAILEPLYAQHPEHPGLAHYLIHSYDSAELAPKGVAAARAYAKIAPSAPHALHMPSHIFTRLGMWDDSIASNLASRQAAHMQGDIGEELHAMDYLVYAYLQRGRYQEAGQIVEQLNTMPSLQATDFKIGYAATAMRARYVIEQGKWRDASALQALDNAPPHVAAITLWARAIGFARDGAPDQSKAEIEKMKPLADQLTKAGNSYWATQVEILILEANAWRANALKNEKEAVTLLRTAADKEDAVEKLPVTPGPIVPAREQLADLLLTQKRTADALQEYELSLQSSPGRRAALEGAARCADLLGNKEKAKQYRASL